MLLFDGLLAVAMIAMGITALFAKDRLTSVAAFLLMGLFVALSWVRLGAPDVALAEAAGDRIRETLECSPQSFFRLVPTRKGREGWGMSS